MTSRNGWLRVRKDRPCPICGRTDWCLVSADGSAAICSRIESSKRCGEAGYLHRLRDDDQWQDRPQRIVRSIPLTTASPRHDLANLAAGYREAVDTTRLEVLAGELGLSVGSLVALRVGWSVPHRAWSFPMVAAAGDVLGIRLRRANGSKFAVTGGKEGLFIPAVASTDNRMMICEGATDTAALLDLGFRNAVGRPSCTGGIKLLVDLARQRQPAEVVIVADSDEPGRRGADNLASVLLAYAPVVRVVVPQRHKDVREFLRAGGTREQLEQAIEAAPARRLVVRAVAAGEDKR